MSYRPFPDEEEVLVLSTRQPLPRWLRWILLSFAILAGVALVVALFIGWRYYSVQQRVKKDLAAFIAQEEEVRSLGGINAAPDLIVDAAPDAWRYRYLTSIRAHKGRPIPDLALEKVDYDGSSARAHLLVNGSQQFRAYQLQRGQWRRAPFVATGWGEKQVLPLPEGIEIIYWDEDEDFVGALAEGFPKLLAVMQTLGLAPTAEAHRLIIIPKEFGDRVQPATRVTGVILNSPHVDLIPQEPGNLTPEEELRLALARKLLKDARDAAPTDSDLPGAARVLGAIDEVMAWGWAAGRVSDAAVADWATQLKGEWVSPVTGLPPDLIAKLPPNAGDLAARLMMTYLLRQEGVDALVALNEAMLTARSWDEAYSQAVGKTARQVEDAARLLAQDPSGPLPDWPDAAAPVTPSTVTFLNRPSFSSNLVLARLADGDVIAMRLKAEAPFVMVDGSPLSFDCIGMGSVLRVTGKWIDVGLQLAAQEVVLEQAILPPIVQTPPMSLQAWALVARLQPDSKSGRLLELYPDGGVQSLADLDMLPLTAGKRAPPLLVWSKETRCDRPWIVAYRPDEGVVGAWLAPEGSTLSDNVLVVDDSEIRLLLAFDARGMEGNVYETGENHTLRPLAQDDWQTVLKGLSPEFRIRLVTPEGRQQPGDFVAVQDLVTGEKRILYYAQEGEVIAFPVVVIGALEDALPFALGRSNRTEIVAMSVNEPGPIERILSFPQDQPVMPMFARCPDGSYLYARLRGEPGKSFDSALLLRHPDGRDEPVSDWQPKMFLFPFYCARTP